MMDNFLLGVQGSGYVDYGDGNLNYLAYAGQTVALVAFIKRF